MSDKIIPFPSKARPDKLSKRGVCKEDVQRLMPRALLHAAAIDLSKIAQVSDPREPLNKDECETLDSVLNLMAAAESIARERGEA